MRVVSEGATKITKATIEAAWRRRIAGHRLIVRDKDCRGLALIVNATSMTWTFAYRPRGTDSVTGQRWPNRTVTLGNPATHSPDDARTVANVIKGQAAAGADPVIDRKARAKSERRKQALTFGRLAENYALAFPRRQKMRGSGRPSPAYVAEELSQLRLAMAAIRAQNAPVTDIGLADVRRLLVSPDDTNPRARFGALSRFFDWCQDGGYLEANPCALVPRSRRPRAPQPRAHYLTPNQLAQLWRATDNLREPVWRDYTRFLIVVPCRRGEAAQVDWLHIDLADAEWRQPGRVTKNRDPHRLHLHPLALEVLNARREATGGKGLVFPAPVSGRAMDTFTAIKQTVSDAAELTGWTWHDFRRSFATALGEAGIPETVADAILNHRQSATRGSMLGVYQRASRWPEQVKAMELWGRMLADAIEGRDEGAEVVQLQTRVG
jgi:integrase